MNSNEHEEMNINQSSDKPERPSVPAPADEESAVSDLLHVLGFRKKKRVTGIKKIVSQTPGDASVSDDYHDQSDSLVSNDLAVSESQNDAETNLITQEHEESTAEANFKSQIKPKTKMLVITVLTIAVLVVCLIYAWPYITEPVPPGEDVVASYSGRNITIEELKSFIALEQAKEYEHSYCEIHGYDHSKCTPDEECESHPIDSIEGYKQMITSLAIEQIIQDWASTQGITQREDVQHGIKDLLDDANVTSLIEQLHEEQITPESISSWEVQQYYNDNKETYNGKSLSEVEDEIRQILVTQKDEDFLTQYIEKLKQTAGLKVNLDLLKVSEPTDDEILAYYNQNTSEYQVGQTAEVLEIRITSGDTQNAAAEAIQKIRSGESFDSVAAAYGQGGQAGTLTVEKGTGEAAIEDAIWKMQPGDISSPVTNTDGSSSIIKLVSITKAGIRPLSEVKSSIRSILLQKNMESEYTLRNDEALFSVHSRRYTLGDFYTEFNELPAEYQAQFSTFEQKQQLVEQLIAKELLLEETGDASSDESQQHGFDELKIQYLAQILHQQEVDEKLTEPTEAEMKEFYDKNKESFMIPASAQISLIWIDQGGNGEKKEQARQKADEAVSLINEGVDFAEVAKKYSEDTSAISGGVINGVIYQYDLPNELASAIFALKAGDISDIIDYNYGYFIVKVREREDERQQNYEESAEIIKEHLKEEIHSELESGMEKVLLDNADFIIYDKTLRRLLKEQTANNR